MKKITSISLIANLQSTTNKGQQMPLIRTLTKQHYPSYNSGYQATDEEGIHS